MVVYGFAVLGECMVLLLFIRSGLSLLWAFLTALTAWWVVLFFFWSQPICCRFEFERHWLHETKVNPGRTLARASLSFAYWPLLIPKNVCTWTVIIGLCIFEGIKWKYGGSTS